MSKSKKAFFTVPNDIFSYELTPYELAVLFCLCKHADNKSHTCWPSEKSIARECGMSQKSVYNATRKLESKELIQIQKHYCATNNGFNRQTANRYTVLITEEKSSNTTPDSTVYVPPLYHVPPPIVPNAGEINKTKPNITIPNITIPTEQGGVDGKENFDFLNFLDSLSKDLQSSEKVGENEIPLVLKAIRMLYSREKIAYEGETLDAMRVRELIENELNVDKLQRALDFLRNAPNKVNNPAAYLEKCILGVLLSPNERYLEKRNEGNFGSFNIDDFFEAAMKRSYSG